MSALELMASRRSVRRYDAKKISDEDLISILEAGRQAPSAANRQPVKFVVVTDDELKKGFSNAPFNDFIKKAPVVIVACADVKNILTGKWAVVDASIALENMVIVAWSLGVGSCWIGAFKEKDVKSRLKIPDKWKVVALLTLGYPIEQSKPVKKKSFEELFSFNVF